ATLAVLQAAGVILRVAEHVPPVPRADLDRHAVVLLPLLHVVVRVADGVAAEDRGLDRVVHVRLLRLVRALLGVSRGRRRGRERRHRQDETQGLARVHVYLFSFRVQFHSMILTVYPPDASTDFASPSVQVRRYSSGFFAGRFGSEMKSLPYHSNSFEICTSFFAGSTTRLRLSATKRREAASSSESIAAPVYAASRSGGQPRSEHTIAKCARMSPSGISRSYSTALADSISPPTLN